MTREVSSLEREADEPRLSALLLRLAQAHRILAAQGHGDGTLGHVSVRDPQGRGFWLKRSDIGMDEVTGERDLLLVGFDGEVLAGTGGLHSEWPIHAAPMLHDLSVQAVVHTHARAAALLSAADLTITPLTSDGAYLAAHPVRVHRAPRAHIDDRSSAEDMLATMGAGPLLLVRNHGIVTRAASLEIATLTAMFAERAAETQLKALAAGSIFSEAAPEEVAGRAAMLKSPTFTVQNFDYHARHVA